MGEGEANAHPHSINNSYLASYEYNTEKSPLCYISMQVSSLLVSIKSMKV